VRRARVSGRAAAVNHKDALPIEQDDRRWLILFSAAKKRPAEYYSTLFRNIADRDKVAAVMDYLLNHKITFNPKAPAPYTEAKREMGERARSDVETHLQTLYDERQGCFADPLVRFSAIMAAIKDVRPNERYMSAAALAFLDRIGARKLRRYTKGKGVLPAYQLYAVRDPDHWDALEPIDVMRAFMAQFTDDDDDFG